MDISKIKDRLDNFNRKGGKKSKKPSHKFKPNPGDQKIRILPYKYNKDYPFIEMKFYYNIGGRTIPSPLNWDKKDPIHELAQALRKKDDPEDWKMAKELSYKIRTFCPVIVRGEEEKGVKFWEFGKTIYEPLLNLAADEEVGDYTDINQGRDIKLHTTSPEENGSNYNKTTITPAMSTSPISEDADQIEKWINEQPNLLDLYDQLSYDEIKEILSKHFSPSEDETEEGEESEPEIKGNFKVEAKTSTGDKWDNLFEEESTSNEDKRDDLPF